MVPLFAVDTMLKTAELLLPRIAVADAAGRMLVTVTPTPFIADPTVDPNGGAAKFRERMPLGESYVLATVEDILTFGTVDRISPIRLARSGRRDGEALPSQVALKRADARVARERVALLDEGQALRPDANARRNAAHVRRPSTHWMTFAATM